MSKMQLTSWPWNTIPATYVAKTALGFCQTSLNVVCVPEAIIISQKHLDFSTVGKRRVAASSVIVRVTQWLASFSTHS